MRRSIVIILAVAGLTACAPAAGNAPDSQIASARDEPGQCFDPARIVNYTRGESGMIYVRALNRDVFAITGAGCPDIGAGVAISIAPAIGIGSRLCVGDSANVVTPAAGFGPARCRARVHSALTEAEVEALPSRFRP